MTAHREARTAALLTALLFLLPAAAPAVVTVYFDPSQVATLLEEGVTSDTIACQGYLFTYTRDKLFTGGTGQVIGRGVRIPWPDGLEAQYVTEGPNPTKASIKVRRQDGGVFDLTSFTAHLLANAGAGRAIEIVPLLGGQELLPDPLSFDVSGNYGMEFSYDTSPNPWGSTAALVGYDEYRINLTLDYALTALTLTDASQASAVGDDLLVSSGGGLVLAPNPASGRVRISPVGRPALAPAQVMVYSLRGERVRTLECDAAGRTSWDLRDQAGAPVAAGVYFVGTGTAGLQGPRQRLVVVR
jgi:hypothetical protein